MSWFNVLKGYAEEIAALNAQIEAEKEKKRTSGVKCPKCGGRNIKCWNQKRKGGKVTSYTGLCECFDGCSGEIDHQGQTKNYRWNTRFHNTSIPEKVDNRHHQPSIKE